MSRHKPDPELTSGEKLFVSIVLMFCIALVVLVICSLPLTPITFQP